MSHVDEEQAIWTVNFKRTQGVEFQSIKYFKQLQHNNEQQIWQHKNIIIIALSSLLLIFELIQQTTLVNFVLLLNILKISKISFWIFWKKNCLLCSCYLKIVKLFIISVQTAMTIKVLIEFWFKSFWTFNGELKTWPKLNFWGYGPRILINPTIFKSFTFLFHYFVLP